MGMQLMGFIDPLQTLIYFGNFYGNLVDPYFTHIWEYEETLVSALFQEIT